MGLDLAVSFQGVVIDGKTYAIIPKQHYSIKDNDDFYLVSFNKQETKDVSLEEEDDED